MYLFELWILWVEAQWWKYQILGLALLTFFFEAFGDCYLEWLLPIYIPTFRRVGDSLSSRRSPAFIAYRLVRMVSLTGGA